MLEVQRRDGAGRTGTFVQGDRRLDLPGLFWLAGRTPPGTWAPLLAAKPDPAATLVTPTRFMDAAPSVPAGTLVLQRRLRASAVVVGDAPGVETVGDSLAVWTVAHDLFHDPRRFAPALARARDAAGFGRALYAPGLGEPNHLALLAYAGVDLFDAVPLHLAAAQGVYLTESGRHRAAELAEAPCACEACEQAPPREQTPDQLATHNQHAARAELAAVRNAIRAGMLRELVEGRVRSDPELTALLRRLDNEPSLFETRAPVHRSGQIYANTKESLRRVECVRFRDRVLRRYRPPISPPVLLLEPCSARKPYSKSRTHRAFADAIWAAGAAGLVHEVVVTSPLGLVPRELELTYPAAHYDVPVTGEWDAEEAGIIRELLSSLLAKRSYARVVSHLPRHTFHLVRDLLPADTLVTCEGENATAPEALRRLELVLRQLGRDHRRVALEQLQLERLRAIADVQFGPQASDALFADARVVGKWPTGKVLAGADQLAMLPTEKGQLSLTLEGGRRLLAVGAHRVEIDDFKVTGGVFAVGVRGADPEIRPGDEVVVHHRGDIRAVGTAMMSGPEMVELRRGEAVNARHHA